MSRRSPNAFLLSLLMLLTKQGSAVNDLNLVLTSILGDMNFENFFLDTWLQYHNTLPIPVPNNCNAGRLVPLEQADDSLRRVIENGVLRIGLNPAAAGAPSIYAVDDDGKKSANITAFSGSALDGYEIACSREGARRLGELYGVEIQPEYVYSETGSYFEPLMEILDNDQVDVIWSNMVVTDERAEQIDFTCNSFSTEVIIAASEKVGSQRPDPNGPPIEVACFAIFCTFPMPPPFVPTSYQFPTIAKVFETLANTTDEYEYIAGPFELIGFVLVDDCPGCVEVDIDPLGSYVRSPGTVKTLSTRLSSSTTANNDLDKTQIGSHSFANKMTASLLMATLVAVTILIMT